MSFVDPPLQLPDFQCRYLNPTLVPKLQRHQAPVEKAPKSTTTPPSSHPCSIVRKMIQNGRLPALPDSKKGLGKVCLGWHTKGMCNSDCGLKYDHIQYTQDEL